MDQTGMLLLASTSLSDLIISHRSAMIKGAGLSGNFTATIYPSRNLRYLSGYYLLPAPVLLSDHFSYD